MLASCVPCSVLSWGRGRMRFTDAASNTASHASWCSVPSQRSIIHLKQRRASAAALTPSIFAQQNPTHQRRTVQRVPLARPLSPAPGWPGRPAPTRIASIGTVCGSEGASPNSEALWTHITLATTTSRSNQVAVSGGANSGAPENAAPAVRHSRQRDSQRNKASERNKARDKARGIRAAGCNRLR